MLTATVSRIALELLPLDIGDPVRSADSEWRLRASSAQCRIASTDLVSGPAVRARCWPAVPNFISDLSDSLAVHGNVGPLARQLRY